MPNSSYARAAGDASLVWMRRSDNRRALSLASLLAVLLIGAGAAISIWRYEAALRNSDAALSASADALLVQQARASFAGEREMTTEYLLHPTPWLFGEIVSEQIAFDSATKRLVGHDSLERALLVRARRAHATFSTAFADNRRFAGGVRPRFWQQ